MPDAVGHVPDLVTVMELSNISPLLNKTESPGKRVLKLVFSLEIDFRSVAGFCTSAAVLVSKPAEDEKK